MSIEELTVERLLDVNQRAHLRLEELWLTMMERLLRVDYEGATHALHDFEVAIGAHAALEDERAIPVLARWLAGQPSPAVLMLVNAEGERGEVAITEKSDQHLFGDHKILLRGLAAMRRQLEALSNQNAPLRQVASVLEPFVRVQSVLEHHTVREQRFLYPVLEVLLSAAEQAALGRELLSSVGLEPSAHG